MTNHCWYGCKKNKPPKILIVKRQYVYPLIKRYYKKTSSSIQKQPTGIFKQAHALPNVFSNKKHNRHCNRTKNGQKVAKRARVAKTALANKRVCTQKSKRQPEEDLNRKTLFLKHNRINLCKNGSNGPKQSSLSYRG